MIPATADEYIPTSSASRASLLALIIGAHALAALGLASLNHLTVIVDHVPLLVRIIPEATLPKPPIPARTIRPPAMRMPEIRLPTLPPIDTIVVVKRVEERPAPRPVEKAAPSSAPPAPVAAPAIEPPRFDLAYLNNPAPSYPVFAKRAREQGVVMLRVRVDAAGSVEGIELHHSSGFQRLDDAALAAVKRWRFLPARAGERAVAGVAIVPIHFELEG